MYLFSISTHFKREANRSLSESNLPHTMCASMAEAVIAPVDEFVIEQQQTSNDPMMKMRFNETLPISTFPPEILCNIFEIIVSRYPHNIKQRLALSHVCQCWRTVSTEYSLLWNTIPRHAKSEYIVCALERSRKTLLTIQCGWSPVGKMPPVWRKIFEEEMHRVHELHVELKFPAIDIVGPALQLKKLKVTVNSDSRKKWAPFEKILDGTDAPGLQSLQVEPHAYTLWSNLPFPPHLTVLEVSTFDWSIQTIVEYLRPLTSLERLKLSDCGVSSMQPSASDPHITMDRLRTISLGRTHIVRAAYLLAHLHLPRIEAIAVRGYVCPPHSTSTIPKIDNIPHLRHAWIRAGDIVSNDIGWISTCVRLTTGVNDEMSLQGLTLEAFREQNARDAIAAIYDVLSVHDVESLTVEGPLPRLTHLKAVVQKMPRLHRVRVHDTSAIVHALTGVLSVGSNTHMCDIEELELDNIHFSPNWIPNYIPKKGIIGKQRAVEKIVYKNCPNLNAHIAAFIRGLTGAVEDNFVPEEVSMQ